MSGLKLNPHIAKELPSGQVQCLVCNMQVKPKVWTAHVNGKKHRDAIDRLKAAVTRPANTSKRPTGGGSGQEPLSKKFKEDSFAPSNEPQKKGDLPADFFDSATSTDSAKKTPWQQEVEGKAPVIVGKDLIEGVPHGFFDDRKKDLKVKNTLERDVVLEEEYEKFMREVNEEQSEEARRAEEEAEREARLREIEHIDEQIAEWQRLNELEKLKEQRIAAAREKKEKREREEMEADNAEEIDDDFDFSDWRKKKIL